MQKLAAKLNFLLSQLLLALLVLLLPLRVGRFGFAAIAIRK